MMAALAAVVLAAGGCTGGSAGRSAKTGGVPPGGQGLQPGAEGVGDPYFPGYGNGGYDVASYGLKLRYEPATDKLTGQALITATTTADLSRFNLDFIGYDIESLRVDGADARYTRKDAELTVTPARGLPSGRKFTVDVRYSGVPQPIGDPGLGAEGFLHTEDGAIALGEPQSASGWFPVNDHPQDKATYAIEVTVPDGLTALSNGVPEGTTKAAGGWTTWKWAEHDPMASYLATVIIGKYRVTTGTHDGRPIVTAVADSIPPGGAADRAMARTGEIADFLATQFGPYPFDAYGGIVHNDDRIDFALETQTRPVYAPGFFQGGDGTTVVAHELSHQWFGDSVSVHAWKDIWLNEGFATYAEWLWLEHVGQATAQESFDRTYQAAADAFWMVAPGEPGVSSLFGSAVYRRGGMTVHALRRVVGDDAFFRILKAWTSERRNGNGTTTEFIALSERISGKPLRPLFEAWLYQKTKPAVP